MKIITLKQSRKLGLKTYFTGKPCKYGHICNRRTDNRKCSECDRLSSKEWMLNNSDKKKSYDRSYHSVNSKRRNASTRSWQTKNRLAVNAHASRYRAIKKLVSVKSVDFEKIWKQFNGLCYICDEPISKNNVHYDHLVPLSKGGSHTYNNLRPTHSKCNQSKNSKTPREYCDYLIACGVVPSNSLISVSEQ